MNLVNISKINDVYSILGTEKSVYKNETQILSMNENNEETISYNIRIDNIELIKKMCLKRTFDYNLQIYGYNLVCYTALIGAFNCFKHFLVNSDYIVDEKLIDCMFLGGNFDILNLLINEVNYGEYINLAVKTQNSDIIDWIIEKFGDDKLDLLESVKNNNIECVYYCLAKKGVDLNYRDCYGNSAIHMSAAGGFLHMTKFLLELGANVNDLNNAVCLYNKILLPLLWL